MKKSAAAGVDRGQRPAQPPLAAAAGRLAGCRCPDLRAANNGGVSMGLAGGPGSRQQPGAAQRASGRWERRAAAAAACLRARRRAGSRFIHQPTSPSQHPTTRKHADRPWLRLRRARRGDSRQPLGGALRGARARGEALAGWLTVQAGVDRPSSGEGVASSSALPPPQSAGAPAGDVARQLRSALDRRAAPEGGRPVRRAWRHRCSAVLRPHGARAARSRRCSSLCTANSAPGPPQRGRPR